MDLIHSSINFRKSKPAFLPAYMESGSHTVSWFWNEMKRRKVIRVVAAYIASAFVLIELLLIITPHFDWPSWILPLVFILLGMGFIVSIGLSWIYDKTPSGIRKTRQKKEAEKEEIEKMIHAHEWKATTYVSLVVIIAMALFHVLSANKRETRMRESRDIHMEETADSDHVFLVVEEMPLFEVAGYRDFRDYINKEISYPERCREEGISGRVYVQFVIKRDGSVDDVRVVRGITEELNAEAIRVVQSSPKWKPGKHKGKAVNVSYSFPVIFSLE